MESMPPNLRAKANGAERTSGSHVKGLALTVMIDACSLRKGWPREVAGRREAFRLLPTCRNPTGFDKSRPSLQRDRMSAHRVSAALRRARSRSRNYHSMRRLDRDIKPTSQAYSPAISGDACAESARRRRSRGHPAQTRRRCWRSAGKDREGNRRLVPTP
jgi:hypothetical protein